MSTGIGAKLLHHTFVLPYAERRVFGAGKSILLVLALAEVLTLLGRLEVVEIASLSQVGKLFASFGLFVKEISEKPFKADSYNQEYS